jgi:hypothetical protein
MRFKPTGPSGSNRVASGVTLSASFNSSSSYSDEVVNALHNRIRRISPKRRMPILGFSSGSEKRQRKLHSPPFRRINR